jgi:DNA mismatch repair ATPase MutS
MKTNFERWLELKRLTENKEKILLFHSGVFYKTFESDAEFLSTFLGFQVLTRGGYETLGFPLDKASLHLQKLREAGYAYQIVKIIEGELHLVEEVMGTLPLTYDRGLVLFWQEKPKKVESDFSAASEFKVFLQELGGFIQTYCEKHL